MLTREAVFRNIDADRVEPIQQHVSVDYDNELQMPVGFFYNGMQFEVSELLGTFRGARRDPATLYLVRTQHGVYALYPNLIRTENPQLWRGHWVLHFRVEEEPEEEEMLVEFKLKQAVDFHGHLCPDLVLGYRISRDALRKLALEMLSPANLRVIVENRTSAVDAVQRLTGCTLGNGRLRVRDYGRHVYTFLYRDDEALEVAIKPGAVHNDPEFLELEARLHNKQASIQQTARYQVLLDELVNHWLTTPFEALFNTRHTRAAWPEEPLTSAMALCERCNQPVLETHLVIRDGTCMCRSCWGEVQKLTRISEEYT